MSELRGYRPDIDGLRAIAVLAVLFFHAELGFPGGFVGVDVFFVISGYLITGILVRQLRQGTFSMVDFWRRRILRILPASTAVVAATVLAAILLLPPNHLRSVCADAFAQFLMLANFQFARETGYFDINSDYRPLLHTWSLAVEEQFYLFHPLALYAIYKLKPKLLVPALIISLTLSLALNVAFLSAYPSSTFYLLPARAWELLLGGCLALYAANTNRTARFQTTAAVAGLTLIAVPLFVYDRSTPFPGVAALPPCIGTALLIYAGIGGRNVITKAIGNELLRKVGLISYSLYLVHWPILAFMRIHHNASPPMSWRMAAVAASFPLAYLSWKYIETPFRSITKRPARTSVIVATAAAVTITLSGTVLTIRALDGLPFRFPDNYKQMMNPEGVPKQFQNRKGGDLPAEELMHSIGSPDSPYPPLFVLMGDSHTLAVSLTVDQSATELGISGLIRGKPATLPVPGARSVRQGESADLANHTLIDWIIAEKIPNVILCARWSVYVDGLPSASGHHRTAMMPIPADTPVHESQSLAVAKLAELMKELISRLETAGVRVWLLTEVPYQRTSPDIRAMQSWLSGGDMVSQGVSLQEHLDHTQNVRSVINASSSPSTSIIDLSKLFFATPEHSTLIDSDYNPYYGDSNHLTPYGADRMTGPLLKEMLEEIRDQHLREQ